MPKFEDEHRGSKVLHSGYPYQREGYITAVTQNGYKIRVEFINQGWFRPYKEEMWVLASDCDFVLEGKTQTPSGLREE